MSSSLEPAVDSSLIQTEIVALKSLYSEMTKDIKRQIVLQLRMRLTTWAPDSNVVAAYPFFANTSVPVP